MLRIQRAAAAATLPFTRELTLWRRTTPGHAATGRRTRRTRHAASFSGAKLVARSSTQLTFVAFQSRRKTDWSMSPCVLALFTRRVRQVPIMGLVWLLMGCIRMGDPYVDRSLRIYNKNPFMVTYNLPNRIYSDKRVQLGPRDAKTDYVQLRTEEPGRPPQVFRLEAEDEQGRLIFCRTYERTELERANWQITIRTGELLCERTVPSPTSIGSPRPAQ